jgi:hypothetical protein
MRRSIDVLSEFAVMTGDSRPIKVTAEEDAVLTMYAPSST